MTSVIKRRFCDSSLESFTQLWLFLTTSNPDRWESVQNIWARIQYSGFYGKKRKINTRNYYNNYIIKMSAVNFEYGTLSETRKRRMINVNLTLFLTQWDCWFFYATLHKCLKIIPKNVGQSTFIFPRNDEGQVQKTCHRHWKMFDTCLQPNLSSISL